MISEIDIVENIMNDTRRDIKYIIHASRKLDRKEMLMVLRLYNQVPLNLKIKSGETVYIDSNI